MDQGERKFREGMVLALLDYVKSSGLAVSNPENRLYKVLQVWAALEAMYMQEV
jgi:hypothetical protein